MKIETINQVNIDAFNDNASPSTSDYLRGTDENQHYTLNTTVETYQGNHHSTFVFVDDLACAIDENEDLKEHLTDEGRTEEEAQKIIDEIQEIIDKCRTLDINKIIL